MAKREIVLYPDDRLRVQCEPVNDITDKLRTLLSDMAETMYAAPGIGLAAPQIGEDCRAIVVDVGNYSDDSGPNKLYKIVNPEIVETHGTAQTEEGCLSIPGVHEKVSRAKEIKLIGLDENGNDLEIEADGILSICLQHEIDHLDGVLFIDHLSKLKKKMIAGKLRELEKRK